MNHLPFVLVRQIFDYAPNIPSWNADLLKLFKEHYKKRICGRCGEYKDINIDSSRNTLCLCRHPSNRLRFHPRKLQVHIRPKVIMRLYSDIVLRKSDILHTMPGEVYDFINQYNISDDVEDFCFVVHHQRPQSLFSFLRAIRNLEHHGKGVSSLNVRAITNMCVQALFMIDDNDVIRHVRSFDQKYEDDIEFGTWHRIACPFLFPISYIFPYAKTIYDLPLDYKDTVSLFIATILESDRVGMVYDPLHLLGTDGVKTPRTDPMFDEESIQSADILRSRFV